MTDVPSAAKSPPICYLQLFTSLCNAVFSIVVCVPMSMHQDSFKGHCALFSTGTWSEQTGQFMVEWASQAYCNFTIFVAVVNFVISSAQTFRFYKLSRKEDASFFGAFCDCVVSAFQVLFSLIAGAFVTAGAYKWCGQIQARFERCSDAAGNDIMRAEGIDTNRFFVDLELSAFGIWGSFVSCFALLVLALLKMGRYLTAQNLRCSMATKRDQLIGSEDLGNRVQEVPVVHKIGGGVGGGAGSGGVGVGGRRRRGKRKDEEGVFEEVKEDTPKSEGAVGGTPVPSVAAAVPGGQPLQQQQETSPIRGRENPSPPGAEDSEEESGRTASSGGSGGKMPAGNRLRLSPAPPVQQDKS